MTGSEKMVEATFEEYRTAGIATLLFLYPKMRPAGRLGKLPAYIPAGKAPYDVAGYRHGSARMIAVEIKENSEQHTSLQIIGPGKKGTGLQWHQLESLVELHNAGGEAYVLWDNAGEWGILDGVRLKQAHAIYVQSLKAEAKGYPNAKTTGTRSIKWGEFKPVKTDDQGRPLYLPHDKTAIAQQLATRLAEVVRLPAEQEEEPEPDEMTLTEDDKRLYDGDVDPD